ncbi:histidinol dehydrogenase [Parasegetibacter sp. NRK P23]|uniref:histidinol dehydrogenase n=1 Tax=Parasegetibacter sp. NRK P23 TaxID=2942999 RepID=UPI00204349F0|nr:histidinol dehydrogenase [Parasegetibacter sp. NRK P23]MCM5526986.1 histidinol dehydrogenase [Parasegetibacter sp. NRK P23]
MQVYIQPTRESWPGIISRPAMNAVALEEKVSAILNDIRQNGDAALLKYTASFDGVTLSQPALSDEEWAAADTIPEPLKAAISQAAANIKLFHAQQIQAPEKVETMPGVVCWRKAVGIEKVGLYIPGGSAPLFSTVLMLGIPASMAGCREIVLCTPPGKDGLVHPAILYAAKTAGITKIFKAGGVQAIGAMAYGTASVPKVYKIFGPGNQFVTCAKQLVQQSDIAIDMPAGPSEVAVFADASANPAFVAADLLSQAEHGPDSQVLLVTTDINTVESVNKALKEQLAALSRGSIATKALENSRAVVLGSATEAMELLNEYAPEHLILATDQAAELSSMVVNAGSVFVGHYSPESAGDYASGTNHTLPTNGYATAYSGVSLDSFVKKITFQQLSREGLHRIAGTVTTMAEAEGLDAHANAVKVRINN